MTKTKEVKQKVTKYRVKTTLTPLHSSVAQKDNEEGQENKPKYTNLCVNHKLST